MAEQHLVVSFEVSENNLFSLNRETVNLLNRICFRVQCEECAKMLL